MPDAPRIDRIALFPVKSLDGVPVEAARLVENGGLDGDRRYAIFDEDGEYVNGKRTPAVHRLRADYDDTLSRVALRTDDDEEWAAFHLDDDRDALEGWLSDYFGRSVTVRRRDEGGFPDDTDNAGPTVISTGTVEEIASWFPGVSVESMRRRLRASVEVAGVTAFWEDRLCRPDDRAVTFDAGDVRLLGTNLCRRCVVPSRDPDTGEEYEGFRRTFLERREATRPPWADPGLFDTFYRAMVNTVVPESEWGKTLRVGDELRVHEDPSVDASA